MGYGGNLIWTSVIKTLHERDGRPRLVKLPGPSDLIAGRLYDGGSSFENDEIFRHNPHVVLPPTCAKSGYARLFDSLFWRVGTQPAC